MRILLVDDDENLMQSLAERLIRQRYAVDIAVDGGSAATYVDLFEYDLIVLDLMLPDGDGIAFCRVFRKQGYANPLMILTAKESTQQKVAALDAGADDYVVKPFDFDELCARIRALLRREHQSLPPVLSLGALSLDPSACETTYQGQLVRLTPKEFSLMELFLRHPHRVYSLGAIIDDLWSFDDPPGEDAVRTHIKGVRRKLRKAGAPKDLIKTVYGLGYRLNENAGWISPEPASQVPVSQAAVSQAAVSQAAVSQSTVSQAAVSQAAVSQSTDSLRETRFEKVAAQQALQTTERLTPYADRQSPDDRTLDSGPAYAKRSSPKNVSNQPTGNQSATNEALAHTPLAGQLSDAYHRYLRVASDQIATLEMVATAVENQSLDATLYKAGCVCAHKLVGSLDSFGIAHASQVARKIDSYLQSVALSVSSSSEHPQLNRQLNNQLRGWITQLRDRIDQATTQTLTTAVQAGLLTVLIVSKDAPLTEQLFRHGQQADLQVQVVATYQEAEVWLAKSSFSLIVCDVGELLDEATMMFLATLKQAYALPIVVLGGQLPLQQRLLLAQQGDTIVSDRTQPPAQLINSLISTLQSRVQCLKIAIAAAAAPETLSFFQSSLKPWDFQITPFNSATELWQWLNDESPQVDALVLDIEMPQLNGIELCQILRADARFQSIPILFLTRHTEPDIRTQAYQAGADDVIHKAVAPAELATRLHNQMARACRL